MATNPPKGDGHRNGAVRNRSQVFNPKTNSVQNIFFLKKGGSLICEVKIITLVVQKKQTNFRWQI